jgi:hypothetical protein
MLALAYFHMHTVRTFIHGYPVSHFFLVLVLGFNVHNPPQHTSLTHFAHIYCSYIETLKQSKMLTERQIKSLCIKVPICHISPPTIRP